jgi:catechol 2,3-dioxygenase-like lactoylglutathione lyase family enzyme
MMFKRIDHVEIVTDQLDRTVEFYTEVLGFTVKARDRIERSGLGVPIDLVYLDLGGTVVELISYEGVTVDPAPQQEHLGYRMMALEVDDMQKTTDYLRTKGVDIDRYLWGGDDCRRAGLVEPRRSGRALSRPRALYGASWQCWD